MQEKNIFKWWSRIPFPEHLNNKSPVVMLARESRRHSSVDARQPYREELACERADAKLARTSVAIPVVVGRVKAAQGRLVRKRYGRFWQRVVTFLRSGRSARDASSTVRRSD